MARDIHGVGKISKFKAIQMASEHRSLLDAARTATQPALAEDFRRRAEIIWNTLALHGWRFLPDGINIEKVR